MGAFAGGTLDDHLEAFLASLLARDALRAHAAVDAALAAGIAVRDLYLGMLQPALYRVGHRWACEELTVADEHFATSVVEAVIGRVGPTVHAEPRDGLLAVVACTPEERHVVGARMVCDLLRAEGWEVIDLGGSTPAADLAALVSEERPDAVLLSTSTAGAMPGAEETLRALGGLRRRPTVVVGGQLWTAEAAACARALGADLVVRDVRMLASQLTRRRREL